MASTQVAMASSLVAMASSLIALAKEHGCNKSQSELSHTTPSLSKPSRRSASSKAATWAAKSSKRPSSSGVEQMQNHIPNTIVRVVAVECNSRLGPSNCPRKLVIKID